MKWTRRTLLKAGSLSALSLAFAPENASIAKAALSDAVREPVDRIPTICGLCKASCPMLALKDKDGHIRLTGNPASPIHGRSLCARGMAAVELLGDPDRLKYPLKRVGPRGKGQWKRITWPEAMAEINRHLKKTLADSGPDSLALLCGSSSAGFIRTLFEGLSCPNIYDSGQARSAAIRSLGYGTVFGQVPDPDYMPELESADCLVLMGCHVGENNQVAQLKQVCDFLERGGRLIVVDPRFSAMSAKADHYLAIKPGTDTALLLGWIHHILANDLYDPLLEEQVVGLEELRAAVADYTLDRTAEITDLPAQVIRQAVEAMTENSTGTIVMPGSHLSWYGADVSRVRAQAILSALLGSWPTRTRPTFDFESRRKPLSFSRLIQQINSGEIKVTAIWGQNPLQAEMAPYKTMQALKNAEFIFACDVLPTEPTLYADIVLPEAAFLERMDDLHFWDLGGKTMVGCRFPVVSPAHECRDSYQIVRELARGCGQGNLFRAVDVQHHLTASLVRQGSSLPLIKRSAGLFIKEGTKDVMHVLPPDEADVPFAEPFGEAESPPQQLSWPTPSGKIEFYSAWLAHNGFAPLPEHVAPLTAPEGYLRLLYGRCPVHSLTRTAGFRWLNHEISENELWLAPSVAKKLGIVDGSQVRLESDSGVRSLTMIKVKVTPGIRADCCYMSHGFGNRSPFVRDAFLRGVSDAALMIRGRVDEVSSTRGLRDTFVRLLRGANDT
ncbi:MAG: hypothetical protein C0613_11600 [Desulfobulbaceae bacterium]|nr:MAG: hypothetical protein C0613_11600 [Desulfobulbaceae bacterium]